MAIATKTLLSTCATFDEFRFNVSFNRLNEDCSCAMNKCSCRKECAKSIISNKLPLLIGCILERFQFIRKISHPNQLKWKKTTMTNKNRAKITLCCETVTQLSAYDLIFCLTPTCKKSKKSLQIKMKRPKENVKIIRLNALCTKKASIKEPNGTQARSVTATSIDKN